MTIAAHTSGNERTLTASPAGERHEVHAGLDQGAKLLEGLAKPEHPEKHFVFDHTKWIFYAADCYTWLGDDEPAEEHAREIIAYHTRPDGSSNAMRSANSHMDLAVIRARHGDLDEAVHHGLAAFGYDRKPEASLLSRAADLDHILSERYPGERLADDFHERYLDARAALRRRTHTQTQFRACNAVTAPEALSNAGLSFGHRGRGRSGLTGASWEYGRQPGSG